MPNNRKPAHIEQSSGKNKREQIWSIIRRLKTFTRTDIQGELKVIMPLATIRSYIQGLEAAGIISTSGTRPKKDGRGYINVYKLEKDSGIEAPRVRKDGSEVTQGRGREQLWRTIKILKQFNRRDLALAASTEQHPVKESEAASYAEALHHADYLILVKPSTHGKQAVYRFNPRYNTGPKPPQIQRLKTLYDPNLGMIVYQEGVDHDLD
ncbi:MAG: hypothetical protein DRQ62_04040 [Gammaproteobacteria bacterium]|nr:MAG: hypothetical protein DRQ62_04040 [Gammaproteobacteria bacterium]